MKILIIGSGGREHSLVWKLKQSPKVSEIFVAPGNAETAEIAKNVNISSAEEIIKWVKENPMDLIVVTPDNYLAEGLVDKLQEMNIPIFGPTKAAAEIEWSKAFSKQFMKEEGIPTAKYEVFTNIVEAKNYLKNQKFPIVIKASGLAFGKGVVIANTKEEAENALDEIMKDKVLGEAGNEVIIEEFLEGIEFSVHAFCDGETMKIFPASKDHKRIFENDIGPNTGGMGTIIPVPGVTTVNMKEIEERVIKPTLEGLKRRGRTFKGILFPGIMITSDGIRVLEFNARFGDPETQSYMRILETDLVDILLACVNGTLKDQEIRWSSKSTCCIVCASGGYPGKYEKEKVISGLEADEDIVIFHAGTKLKNNKVVTNGGRVLGVTATGDNLARALEKAYKQIEKINFEGMQYRKDIGKR